MSGGVVMVEEEGGGGLMSNDESVQSNNVEGINFNDYAEALSQTTSACAKVFVVQTQSTTETTDRVSMLSCCSVESGRESERENQGSHKHDRGHEFRQLHPVFEEGMESFSLRLANAGS
ncbi:Hypothetical predicted protein [Xyrichtys novacula]|uniref:Uncharacterized protein n=1 Tax=Xyrichtys novacula TaxID=13765 RepID=A0AAV1F6C2_XYRNO|nr:Hypothetical predicted protein [Xyrichtys novacula]